MTTQLEVKQVPFLGSELMAARDDNGQIWAGVRWMCDGLGMSEGQRKRQIANIQTDKVLSKGGSNLILNTSGYGEREVLCLALDYVPLWLAKISITPAMQSKTPELADKLEQYQLRAKDVLAAAFLPASASTSTKKYQYFAAAVEQVVREQVDAKLNEILEELRAAPKAHHTRPTPQCQAHSEAPDTTLEAAWKQLTDWIEEHKESFSGGGGVEAVRPL